MSHLTNEQLTLLLYGEAGGVGQAINDHLEGHLNSCSECRERYQQLEDVKQALSSFEIGEQECRVDVQTIVDSQPALGQELPAESKSPAWMTTGQFALVASLLVLIGGLSFLLGANYRTQRTSDSVKAQVELAFAEFQHRDQEHERQLGLDLALEFQNHLSELEKSLSEQGAQISDQNLVALKNIESHFERFLIEQKLLRRDLQTLAVNAEGEIASARSDIRRIDEFVSILVPPNQ